MSLISALLLGIVQGLTEFLPISSTAHVEIARSLLDYPSKEAGAAFTAVIQLGTLAAVLVYFRSDLSKAFRAWVSSIFGRSITSDDARLGWAVFIGTVPIVVIGLLFQDAIETTLRSFEVMACALIGVGLLMLIADRVAKHSRPLSETRTTDGVIVGFWQALALIPGCSRSGSTITGALFAGFDRESAARFSFLLSIPSILMAGLYELFKFRKELLTAGATETLLAILAAFVVGYWSIDFLLKFLRTKSLLPFVLYRFALAAFLFVAARNHWITQ